MEKLVKKITKKGSSLVTAMIFGFVVLVTVSGIVYIVRYNLLSIKGLAGQEKIITAEQQYIQDVVESGSIRIGENKLGNYEFENILQNSQPIFSNKNVDISLYNAQPSAISSDILHNLIYKKNLKITKNIIYKSLPEHSMIDYGSGFVPINVPYVDISRMNNTEKYYHLNNQNKVSDMERGFIGYIKKEYNWLLISVGKNVQVINLKDLDISGNYKVDIGWHLLKGHWQLLMVIYDKDHISISKTSLGSLTKNFNKAIFDLSRPINIIDAPTSITAVSWHYQKDNSEPSLVVLSTRFDNHGKASVIVNDIEFDKEKSSYTTYIKDAINGLGEITNKNVYVEALDPYYTLSQSPLYIFTGNRVTIYNIDNSSHESKKEAVTINSTVSNKPIIVKKDSYSNYILMFDKDKYYQYKYTKNTNVMNRVEPTIYPEEKIQNIIVKYGLKFIVTKKNVYINDFDNKQLDKVSI